MAETTPANSKERVRVGGRELVVTNLDKVMYPETGTTKADVLAYYAAVAPVLIPAAANRPATRKRWVHGVGTADAPGEMFFQKNLDHSTPGWVPRASITHKERTIQYPLVNDPATLAWLAQIAALEIHVPQWRVDSHGQPMPPDRLVLDLDPGEGAGLAECVEVAKLARTILQDVGLDPVPVTSGSKGIHLYAALDGTQSSRADLRVRPRTGPRAGGRPPGPGRQRHEEDAAHRQGPGGLEPEQRRQDHHRPLFPARAAPAHGGGAPDLARTQLAVPAPARLPGGPEAGEVRQGPVRRHLRQERPGRPAAIRATPPDRPATAATPTRGWRSTAPSGTRPRPRNRSRPSGTARRRRRGPRRRHAPGEVRHPGTPRQPAALRLPAGARRRAGVLGAAQGCPHQPRPRTTWRSRPRTTRWTTRTSRAPSPRASTAPGP